MAWADCATLHPMQPTPSHVTRADQFWWVLIGYTSSGKAQVHKETAVAANSHALAEPRTGRRELGLTTVISGCTPQNGVQFAGLIGVGGNRQECFLAKARPDRTSSNSTNAQFVEPIHFAGDQGFFLGP